jgi:hypothetical protein
MVCLYDEVGSNFGDIMRAWRDVMKDEQVVKSPVDISSLPRKPHFMPNYPLDIECVSHLRFLALGFHTPSARYSTAFYSQATIQLAPMWVILMPGLMGVSIEIAPWQPAMSSTRNACRPGRRTRGRSDPRGKPHPRPALRSAALPGGCLRSWHVVDKS